MINLKEMLIENRSNQTARKGCLMAMVTKEDTDKILKFCKQLIKEEDLYLEGNEYGRESDSHVTIRYGFLKDLNELDVRHLIKGQKQFMIELFGLDKFDSSPKYDVAMFKVNSPVLKQLNEASGKFLNENDYPDYKPHMTLAYTQKGKFPHVKEGLKLRVPIKTICYSPISGAKSYFELEENINEMKSFPKIDVRIKELEQEWERLDSTGSNSVKQQEISREIERLQRLKEPRIPINYEKGKELFAKMKQAIQ